MTREKYTMYGRLRLNYRYVMSLSDPLHIIIKYFDDDFKPDLLIKRKMLEALEAFWLPLALKRSNHLPQAELQFYGRRAIAQLKNQILYIENIVGIEGEDNNSMSSHPLVHKVVAGVDEAVIEKMFDDKDGELQISSDILGIFDSI